MAPIKYSHIDNRCKPEIKSSKRRWRSWTSTSLMSHLTILLVGTIIGAFIRMLAFNSSTQSTASISTPIPKNVFSPRIPTIMTPDERFVGWNDAINENWQRVLDGTGEGVWIPDAAGFGLGKGFPSSSHSKPHGKPRGKKNETTTGQFYHISNQHQLHCLNIMRMAHYHRIEDIDWLSNDDRRQAFYHVEHCIEYLRLSIMCSDSLVVEGNSPPGSPLSEIEDPWGNPLGWGITKHCINWENLQRWQRSQLEASGLT